MSNIETTEYKEFIQQIKQKAREAQIKASVRVNSTLIEFYWELGREIIQKEKTANWGSGFLKNLSRDLMREFPNIKGFSKRNLELIRKWYKFYSENSEIAKQAVSQLVLIPWGHNIAIMQKSKDLREALFYVNKTIENGWSRAVLVHQIESQLFERSGKAITNFTHTLPKPQLDLANNIRILVGCCFQRTKKPNTHKTTPRRKAYLTLLGKLFFLLIFIFGAFENSTLRVL